MKTLVSEWNKHIDDRFRYKREVIDEGLIKVEVIKADLMWQVYSHKKTQVKQGSTMLGSG